MIDLVEHYLQTPDKECFYNNRLTGTCFDIRTSKNFLDIVVKGSNDWRDWIRNLIQLFLIAYSVLFIIHGNPIGGAIMLFLSLTIHIGFLLAGLEVFAVLCFNVKWWRYGGIRGYGHSLGGAIIQWLTVLFYIFGKRRGYYGYTTGSPKILSIFAPLFWINRRFNITNYINPRDKVTKVPPKIFGFIKHVGKVDTTKQFGFNPIESHDIRRYLLIIKNAEN